MTFKSLPLGFKLGRRGAPRINVLAESDTDLVFPTPENASKSLIGTVVFNGRYATRVARFQHVVHDGHLVRSHLNDDLKQPYPIQRKKLTAFAVRSLLKGLMLNDPRLITATVEASYLETLFQLADDELAAWMAVNKAQLVRLFGLVSIGMVMKCVSQTKLRDGDVEAQHPEAWKSWNDLHTRKDPTGDTEGTDEHAVGSRIRRNAWVYNADLAIRGAQNANVIRDRAVAAGGLLDAPELKLFNDTAHRELTTADVAAVSVGEG